MFKLKGKKKKEEQTFQRFSVADQIAPAIFEEEKDYIQVGDAYERVLCITDYPSVSSIGFLSKLYRLEGNISFTYHVEPTSSANMIKDFSNSIEELESRLLSGKLNPEMRKRAEQELESANNMLEDLVANDTGGMLLVHFLIRLHAESLEQLKKLTDKVNNAFSARNLFAYVPNSRMQDAFESCLPILENKVGEYTRRNMDTKAFSTFFPFDETELFSKRGIAMGKNMKTKSLIVVNKWELSNRNGIILGQSGYGKTTTKHMLMLRDFMEGIRIFNLDPEGEDTELVQKLGGQVIELSNTTDTIINPLQVFYERDAKKKGNPLLEHLERVKVFFKIMRPSMTIDELAVLDAYLVELYESEPFNITFDTNFEQKQAHEFPILADLYELLMKKLEEGDDTLKLFSYVLKQYVSGANNRIFNEPTNVDLDNQLISFDISRLGVGSALQLCAMFNATSFLWDEITKTKGRKTLFLDELHVFADPHNPQSMEFIYQIWKRIRKYGGSVWGATQQVEELLRASDGKKNYGGAVIENSLMKMFLPLAEKSIHDLMTKAHIKFSDNERRILKPRKKNKGEGIFIYADKRVHLQIEPTEVEWELMGGKPKEGEAI
ncbi:protein TrsE [Bacillus sp. TL12]|uniref:VirB4 family type IV secretion system protein n=1 Tax=Bacillus sp. TL12 TaxID=2894756 RepID=UPI001F517BED|nr:protein TrsE [Bacillus sp. TL12]MCI0767293.1 protein TrsE [Bacillus sp. TL12]